MAVHKSAKKRIRSNARKAVRNKDKLSKARNSLRRVEEALKTGDQKKAAAALKEAQPLLQRTAQKGILHKNTVSRKISRLSKKVKALKK